jgi:hypothetical protein
VAANRWLAVLEDLAGELGVWGEPDPLLVWVLDPTEGPFRMRKKARAVASTLLS